VAFALCATHTPDSLGFRTGLLWPVPGCCLVLFLPSGGKRNSGKTQAVVVVANAMMIVVAVSGTQVPPVVDPGTAATDGPHVLPTVTRTFFIHPKAVRPQ
jgi:hypothetical protein